MFDYFSGFIEFVIDECLFQQGLDLIHGGMDLLPRSFLPHVGDLVQYKTRVKRIDQSGGKVKIQLSEKRLDSSATK